MDKNKKEDSTKYGEFVTSYFKWRTLDEQKKVANYLENITDEDNKEKE